MKYVLLLRGINVGGKNKVKMDELKGQLSALSFANVVSYINSGNLIFESALEAQEIKDKIRQMLDEQYPFPTLFALIDAESYAKTFADLPDWWYGELARRDVLFFTDEVDKDNMVEDIRGMKLHSEAVQFTDIGVFWGMFDEREYLRTAYHKQLGNRVYYKQITIRNGNTVGKILTMLEKQVNNLRGEGNSWRKRYTQREQKL